MSNTAKLTLEGKDYELPTLVGTEKEKAIDIRALRKNSGYITFDPAYVNTGACQSAITFIDGEKGILRYRGIPIEELAEHSTFTEVPSPPTNAPPPKKKKPGPRRGGLPRHSMIHEDM